MGKLGGALALALHSKNFQIENLISKNPERTHKIAEIINSKVLPTDKVSQIHSDLIFITTQDAEIENVSADLARNLKNKPVILHTSGSQSSEILDELKSIDCPTGSFHPLVSISDPFIGQSHFQKAYFCIEGTENALKAGKMLAEALGGKSFQIESEKKALYHAAAVTACGHLVALFDVSLELMEKCGLEKSLASEILMPLIESTIENLKIQSTENALTGTFARADFEVFQKHLAAMQKNVSENAVEIYLQLGLRSLKLTEKVSGKKEDIDKIRSSILLAKNNLK